MNQNNEDYFISPNFQFNDDYNPFQINFQEENYSFIKEIDDDYFISAKQNSFDEKIIPFKEKEKEIIYQDDKLNFEGSNYLAASPLKKEQNILDKVQEISFFDIGSTKTKVSAKMLGHKTKRDNNKIYEDLKIQFNEAIKITKNDNIFLGKTKNVLINEWNKRAFGRKRKSELDKGEHNKHSEDNMMRKIKTFFLNYCHNLLNKSIKNKDLQFSFNHFRLSLPHQATGGDSNGSYGHAAIRDEISAEQRADIIPDRLYRHEYGSGSHEYRTEVCTQGGRCAGGRWRCRRNRCLL